MNSSSRLLCRRPRRRAAPAIGPCATSRPLAMTPMCVDSRSTISRMCEVRKIVPPRATNECSRSLICREATASMPSNGSSRKSRRGAGSSAAASDSFLRMPCEKSVDQRRAGGLRDPSASSRSAARSRATAASSPCTSATKRQRLGAVRRSKSARSSGTTPMRRLTATGSASGSMPRMRIVPARRPQQAGQALDRRRLAGAVRAEEAEEAAGGHGEIDAVDGAQRSERARQPVRLDREIHGGIVSVSFSRFPVVRSMIA